MDTENLDELIKYKRLVTYYLFRDAKEINLRLTELSQQNAKDIKNRTIAKYFDSMRANIIVPFSSKAFPDNWGIIGQLEEVPSDFYVFFDGYIDDHVIHMRNIKEFSLLVEETIIFDYYITDNDLTFLICWDSDHQILIGAGKAKEWVENLIQRHKIK